MKRTTNSLGRSAAYLTASKLVNYTLALLSAMILSRSRTLEEYGTYTQLLLVINLSTTVFMFGIPNSLNYFLSRADNETERNRFLSLYYTFNTLLGVIVGLILVLSVNVIEGYFNNHGISAFVYFLMVYPWARIITSSVENLLVATNKSGYLVIYRIAHSVCTIASILVVQWCGWTFSVYVAVFLGIEAAFALVVYVLANQCAGTLKAFVNRRMLKEVLAFSIPLGLATAVGTLRAETDKILIAFFYDTEKLALYANAAKELPITIISASLTAVLLPKIARMIKDRKVTEAVDLWSNTTELSFIVNSFLACGLFLFSKDAVSFLYSQKYAEASTVFAIYSLVYIVRCTYYGMILNASNNTRLILKCSLISLVLNFVLNIALYYVLGFIGPAVATVVSTFLGAMYLLRLTSKAVSIPFRYIFPWKNCGMILLLNIALGILAAILKHTLRLDLLIGSIAETFVITAVWAVSLLAILRKKIKEKRDILKRIH